MEIKALVNKFEINPLIPETVTIYSGPVIIREIEAKAQDIYDERFYMDGINQLSNAEVMTITIPENCYALGIGLSMKEQRTAGTISLRITKNEQDITGTGLNIQLNESYPLDRHNIVPESIDYEFAAGDKLKIIADSVNWSPLANVGNIYLILKNK